MVLIYTKDGCPHCAAARQHFQAEGIQYEEVNLSANRDRIAEIKQLTASTRVPVIVDNGKVSVGFKGGS